MTTNMATHPLFTGARLALFAALAVALAETGRARAAEPSSAEPTSPIAEPSLADRLRPPTAGLLNFKDGQLGLYPVLEVDVGRKSSAGAAFYAKNLLLAGNQARAVVLVAPGQLFDGFVADTAELPGAPLDRVGVRFGYRDRPDGLFYGIGAETREVDKTFYAYSLPWLLIDVGRDLGPLARLDANLGWRRAEFGGSDLVDDTPSLLERFGAAGQPPLPPGFDGYAVIDAGLGLELRTPGLDARRPVGTGLWLGVQGGYAIDPTAADLSLLRAGADVGGAVDFSDRGHRLGMVLSARLVEALGSTPAPFTELVTLGGNELMRAFLPGRLRGDSAFVTTFFYSLPLGRHVTTEAFLAGGNVFDGRLEDLTPLRFLLNYGVAARAAFSREVSLGLLVGFGTPRVEGPDFRPFEEFRFSLAVEHHL